MRLGGCCCGQTGLGCAGGVFWGVWGWGGGGHLRLTALEGVGMPVRMAYVMAIVGSEVVIYNN